MSDESFQRLGEALNEQEQGAAVTELERVRRLADHGNAQRLVDRHGDDLRYLPGAGWHTWDGTRWLRDSSGEVVRRAREVVEYLYAKADEAERRHGDGHETTKALRSHAKASASHHAIKAMISLAGSDERVLVGAAELDADPYLLNAPNGTIDLRTGELRPHDRADLITRRVAVHYDPDADAPTWRGFLKRVLPDPALRAYLQRRAGQAAIGNNSDELLHVDWGSGANGKSKCSETIRVCLGDYAAAAPVELFLARHAQSAAQPELVRLRGVRLLTAAETEEGSRLNVALVKALTGGDAIAARPLYSNEILEFVPVFSPWLRTNHRPAIREQSEAIWRRVRLMPFTVTIPEAERDIGLQGRLNAELSGVLTWIVQGARRYLAHGLEPPDGVRDATAAYREEEDVLGAFIADRCLTGDGLTATSGDLYSAWKKWAEEQGEKPGTSTAFGRLLTEAGYPRGRDAKGRRARLGVALRGPLDDEQEDR
jgi:putative DNA primase/helicase